MPKSASVAEFFQGHFIRFWNRGQAGNGGEMWRTWWGEAPERLNRLQQGLGRFRVCRATTPTDRRAVGRWLTLDQRLRLRHRHKRVSVANTRATSDRSARGLASIQSIRLTRYRLREDLQAVREPRPTNEWPVCSLPIKRQNTGAA